MEEKVERNENTEIEKLTKIERKVLPLLKEEKSYKEVAKELNEKEVKVLRAFQWLESKGLIKVKEVETEKIVLTERGKEILKNGFPEEILYNLIEEKGEISISEAKEKLKQSLPIALGVLKKLNLIKIESGKIKLVSSFDFKNYELKKCLQELEKCNVNELEKRRIVKKEKVKDFIAKATDEGLKLIDEIKKFKEEFIEKLTSKMLKEKSWIGRKFRKYDVKIKVPKIFSGRFHPYREVINKVIDIFTSMGFREMTHSRLVELALYNFDSLIVPQDHPAREMQDTYYLNKYGKIEDETFCNKVKNVHEELFRSFSMKESARYLLRTHTTATTVNYMLKNKEGKFFVVDRVFRNETVDWKHLCEFYQVEGVIIEKDVSLAMLISMLKEFYKKLGFKKIKVMPTFFPYTEPSLQVMVSFYGKWVELGGAGIFREEINRIFDIKYPIAAFGLGLERLAMLYYNIRDVREIWPKSKLSFIRNYKVMLNANS